MTKKSQFRIPFEYDAKAASDESAYVEKMDSLTIQSMAEDADINIILARFGVTGKMPENPNLPRYGDFSEITSYQDAMNACMKAGNDFLTLPAEIRAKFDNNPEKLIQFVENPANYEAGLAMKLFKERPQNAANVNTTGTPTPNTQTTGGGGSPNPPPNPGNGGHATKV